MAKDELNPPQLDLSVKKPVKLPDHIDDPFKLKDDDKEVEEVIEHAAEHEVEPLLREVELNLKIDDVHAARETYRKLLHVYNGLTEEEKAKYYERIKAYYEQLRPPKHSLFSSR